MMPRYANGFILVTVMSLLLIISLLAIGAAETSLIARRQTNIQWQFWQNRQSAIQAHQHIINTLLQAKVPSCMQAYSVNDKYWHNEDGMPNNCHFSTIHSQGNTVIELLPLSVCDSSQIAVKFYRITTTAQANDGARFHLQSIMVVPANEKTTCQDGTIPLSFGLQSWRME